MGAGDQRRPFAELSPAEQTERRREAARKAAATRARNKAREAASARATTPSVVAQAPQTPTPTPGPVAAPESTAEPEHVVEAQPVEQEHEHPEPHAVGAVAEVQPVEPQRPDETEADEVQSADAGAVEEPLAVEASEESLESEPLESGPLESEPLESEPLEAGSLAAEPAVVEPADESRLEPQRRTDGESEHAEPALEPDADASAADASTPDAPDADADDEPFEVVVVQSDPEASTTLARAEATEAAETEHADEEPADASVDAASAAETDSAAPAVVLQLEGVSRRFGRTVAVEGIDLEVRAGECHGIVGLNGAGKSTTVSIASGLMRPTSGTVRIGGKDVHERGVQSLLGVVPDRMRLFDRLTGRQLLVHAALLRRVPRKDAITRAATLLERFELTPDADRLVADYSIGMQQLVGIAASLIHAPRVVVLDEPFESIDPVATDTILSILGDLRRRGGAVVLTSHDMALVERACDHVVVLHDGVVRASGATDDVRDGLSLEDRFTRLVGAPASQELPWLSPSLG
ncbi:MULTISPECIES: ATP-binding cassette domain-containing protein [unclassified Agrococcus]|uniref:ABC transporter ATP-binding protein n=1 Tax=unclassified Agrococcus TaxID=2615065 RepID=UPI0036085803